MMPNQYIWQSWANYLQRWGMSRWAASLLEATGPFRIIAAQIIYLSQPLLNHAFETEQIESLASLLESEAQTRAFVAYLYEASHDDIPAAS